MLWDESFTRGNNSQWSVHSCDQDQNADIIEGWFGQAVMMNVCNVVIIGHAAILSTAHMH